MSDPSSGDSLLSILSTTAKALADNIRFARDKLDHTCADGTSLLRSKQGIDELERIQWSIDAVIIKEQARGASNRGYVPAMTLDCPNYRKNHMSELGNEVGAMLSVIGRIDCPDSETPDQVPPANWTEFNEKFSEKVECRPDNEEASGPGGARNIHFYYKCTFSGCSSKPLKYKSKLRCVFLMYRREYPPICLCRGANSRHSATIIRCTPARNTTAICALPKGSLIRGSSSLVA